MYAYRPRRNAQQAVVNVQERMFRGHPDVVDADLSDYFGSIPHAELLQSLARRIVDRRVLRLLKQWLECAVEEVDKRGGKTRTTEARDTRCGIPQGSPISPLLANLYMRRFVLAWKQFGLDRRLGSCIVTYADDLVILCRRGKAEEASRCMRMIMGMLKLTVNEEKTRICKLPEETFDLFGLHVWAAVNRSDLWPPRHIWTLHFSANFGVDSRAWRMTLYDAFGSLAHLPVSYGFSQWRLPHFNAVPMRESILANRPA